MAIGPSVRKRPRKSVRGGSVAVGQGRAGAGVEGSVGVHSLLLEGWVFEGIGGSVFEVDWWEGWSKDA